jgi:hypothetical protein
MDRPDEYYTTNTYAIDIESNVRIFAALHLGIADPDDRCISLSVGQSSTTFEADVARGLGTMLLRAADMLDGRAQ